jgi:hypothetical protein
MTLRLVGFFKELGSGEYYHASIRQSVQADPARGERLVIDYLEHGHVLIDVPETSTDVISGGRRIIGASSLLTDGTWLWRRDLPYYVGTYHLSLPEDFLQHLQNGEFKVPAMSGQELEKVGQESLRFF